MELTSLTPKSLPPADSLPANRLCELTHEEAALLHRLEIKVERALYRAAVGLTQLSSCESYAPTHPWLAQIWGNEQKIEGAFAEASKALGELQASQLYRATHQCFNQYLSERFGWFKEEIYPLRAELSK